MSADNYILVRQEDTKWVGYMEYMSVTNPSYIFKVFDAPNLEKAVISAQGMNTEYGYKFEFGKDEE